MCGIAGISMFPKERTEMELAFIRELSAELAVENQARGSHATGIATMNSDGHNVLKHNVSADELTSYASWVDFTTKNINNKTKNILIHTRMATQGSPKNNDNNHPLVTATNVGIHNGMIYNDDALFNKENLERLAEVDSEVIFRLIDKELNNDKASHKNVAEKLTGVFAVASVQKDEPNKLNYFRDNNPTTFAYLPELNIIVFASVKSYIFDAIDSARISCYYLENFTVETGEIEYFEPKKNTVMQFNVNLDSAREQLFTQDVLDFEENYTGYYQWYDEESWYDDFKNRGNTNTTEEYVADREFDNIYDFAEENLRVLMSDDDYSKFVELLDNNETNHWTTGYKAGRESTEADMQVLREQVKGSAKMNA